MARPRLSVIVPAFNEEARLPRTLARLHEYYSAQPYGYEVMVVDDGSRDATAAIVRIFAEVYPHVSLRQCHENRGKGCAVRTGVLESKGDLVLFCDADLATPQEETECLLRCIEVGADVAIGSRPLRGSRVEARQPRHREWMGRAFNAAVQVLGVRGIRDTQCGFKMFRREAAHDIFSRCKIDGFGFDVEALMIARDLGYRIEEAPIRWSHQEGSKVHPLRDGTRMLTELARLRVQGRRRRIEVG